MSFLGGAWAVVVATGVAACVVVGALVVVAEEPQPASRTLAMSAPINFRIIGTLTDLAE